MNKRGQFFLIASLVLVTILVSLTIVYNTSIITEEDVTTFDLTEELDFEVSQVIDNGVLKGESDEDINEKIQDLSEEYSKLYPNQDLFVAYGDQSAIYYGCTKEVSSGISLDTTTTIATCEIKPITVPTSRTEYEVYVNLPDGTILKFNLERTDRLFIVSRKTDEYGEEYLASNTDLDATTKCAPAPEEVSIPCFDSRESSTLSFDSSTVYVDDCAEARSLCTFICKEGYKPSEDMSSCVVDTTTREDPIGPGEDI